ncbi:MAG: hypothetical protein ABR564_06490 [Candidatus Dormibacteria bacterium]
MTIRFDHTVFTSKGPTRIPVDPATASGNDKGHLSLLSGATTVDGEPDCLADPRNPNGDVRPCEPADLIDAQNVDRLRPRVALAAAPAIFVGRRGLLQIGRDEAPADDNIIKGLMISGAFPLRGAIEVVGHRNRIAENVFTLNNVGTFVAGSGGLTGEGARGAEPGGNVIVSNYYSDNGVGIVLAGAGNTIGQPQLGNLIRSTQSGLNGISFSTGTAPASGPVGPYAGTVEYGVRSNGVFGNLLLGPGNAALTNQFRVGIAEAGVGNIIGGSNPGQGNRITGWSAGIVSSGIDSAMMGNQIDSNRDYGIDLIDGSSRNQRVGGVHPGEGNAITSSGIGVTTWQGSRNQILGNRIGANASGAICQLKDTTDKTDGCRPTHLNPGVTELHASPTTLSGSARPGALIEGFVGSIDPQGRGQGDRFIGRAQVAGNGHFAIDVAALPIGTSAAVTSTDDNGTSAYSGAVQVGSETAVPAGALSTPEVLKAEGGEEHITLKWQPVAGAAGYEVHRLTAPGFLPSPETFHCSGVCPDSASTFIDSALPPGVIYHYRVIAYDANGHRGPPSEEASATASALPTGASRFRTFQVNELRDNTSCVSQDRSACLSLWGALSLARRVTAAPGATRAVITFDPRLFKGPADGGPTKLDGCCLNLGSGGIVLRGEERVDIHNPGRGGAHGVAFGIKPGFSQPIDTDDNVITGMRFSGLGAAVTISGRRNTIGQQGAGNDFSANEVAVDFMGMDNVVSGNRLGGQRFRTASAFNSGTGILIGGADNVVGGSPGGMANVITESTGSGVRLVGGASGNAIAGNLIGIDSSGQMRRNQGPGVLDDVAAGGNQVSENVIAGNGVAGVERDPMNRAPLEITHNSIYANGGRGISVSGISPSCDIQGTPPPPPAFAPPGGGAVSGSACPGARVELFGAVPDASGAGQGKTFLASTTANGRGAFAFTGLSHLERILTATATVGGATSEFAKNLQIAGVNPPGAVLNLAASPLDSGLARLSWGAPGDDGPGHGLPAPRYQVRQSISPITDANFDAPGIIHLCDGVCFSGKLATIGDPVTLSVSKMEPGVTYHWAVRAENHVGLVGPVSQVSTALSCPPLPPLHAGQLAYPPGWNLVGLPGNTYVPTQPPLFGWFDQGLVDSYHPLPLGDPVSSDRGYWAWFACSRIVDLSGPGRPQANLHLGAGHASMVGNTSGTSPVTVTGHDFAARWDLSLNNGAGGYRVSGFRQPQRLAPGEGIWVFSYADTTIKLSS